jgi:O-antigen/teichoic acid export membrane protein
MQTLRKIALNTSFQIGGKIISTVLGIAAVMILTRYLGVEQFGWYTTAVGFLQFIGLLSDFGFTVTTANMLSEPTFEKNRLFNTLFTWRFLTALLFNGLAPILIIFFPYPPQVKLAVIIAAISFFALALNQAFIGYYQAKIKTNFVAIGEIVGRIVLLIGVILAFSFNWGFLWIMTIVALGSIINLFYLWHKSEAVHFSLDQEISRAIYKKIWPNATAVIFNAFYLQGDRVILPLFVSQTLVGLYGAAYRVLDIVIQIATLIMGIMLPLITFAWSRGQTEEFKERYRLAINISALVLFPLLVGIVIKAEPIMNFVASEKFVGSGNILRYLALSILGICWGVTFGYTALAINRQRRALWIYGSNAILSILGYFIFIPRFGVWGAVGVTIFSEIYSGLLLFILVTQTSKVLPKFFTLGKIVLASMLMGLVLIKLSTDSLFISILIGILSYALLVLGLKIISWDIIKKIIFPNTVAEDSINKI